MLIIYITEKIQMYTAKKPINSDIASQRPGTTSSYTTALSALSNTTGQSNKVDTAVERHAMPPTTPTAEAAKPKFPTLSNPNLNKQALKLLGRVAVADTIENWFITCEEKTQLGDPGTVSAKNITAILARQNPQL